MFYLPPQSYFRFILWGNQNFPSHFPLISFQEGSNHQQIVSTVFHIWESVFDVFIKNRFQWRMGGNAQFPLLGLQWKEVYMGSIILLPSVHLVCITGRYHYLYQSSFLKQSFKMGSSPLRINQGLSWLSDIVKWQEWDFS